MSGRISRGVGVGALVGALWLGTIAAPASAANHVRWVNDGGKSGPSACATAPFSSIQDAIDASSNGDTVYVCPGTYTEQITVNVNNLLLKSRPRHAAKIVAPPIMTEENLATAVVRLNGWGDRLVGFDIGIPSGDELATDPVGPSFDGLCTRADAAVWATNGHQRVNRNVIHPIGPYSLSGGCGYMYGIVFAPATEAAAAGTILTGSEVSRAGHNKLTDFQYGGILADGLGTKVQIDHNRLTYLHSADPNCVVPFGAQVSPQACITAAADLKGESLSSLLENRPASGSDVSPLNGFLFEPFGIGAENYAAADITYNNVHSGFSFIGPSNSMLLAAVWLLEEDGSSRVRANNLTNAVIGVATGGLIITSSSSGSSVGPAEIGVGSTISRNVVLNNAYGAMIQEPSSIIARNTVTANLGLGIQVDSTDNYLHDNNFAFNLGFDGPDCLDNTKDNLGPGTGTLGTWNNWVNNIGVDSYPNGLCTPPFPEV